MHEPGKHVGPSRVGWDPGNGPLGENPFSESDLDGMFVELKVPEEVSPGPGFYARVMDRIEAQRSKSVWAVFLQPMFGRRLALASGVLMVILGAALFMPGTGVDDQAMGGTEAQVVTTSGQPYVSQVIGSPDQDQNAVLVNLVTYQEH
ncbi:MAG TPA: hypothetical protein VGL72_11890 [Bryobacteraceae bacterium]|jgi:hypothetical protein